MSLSLSPVSNRSCARRLTDLSAAGRCVELRDVTGGVVVWTAFDDGGEFWLIPDGVDPKSVTFDDERADVPEARLIVSDGEPVADVARIKARDVSIIECLPDV